MLLEYCGYHRVSYFVNNVCVLDTTLYSPTVGIYISEMLCALTYLGFDLPNIIRLPTISSKTSHILWFYNNAINGDAVINIICLCSTQKTWTDEIDRLLIFFLNWKEYKNTTLIIWLKF